MSAKRPDTVAPIQTANSAAASASRFADHRDLVDTRLFLKPGTLPCPGFLFFNRLLIPAVLAVTLLSCAEPRLNPLDPRNPRSSEIVSIRMSHTVVQYPRDSSQGPGLVRFRANTEGVNTPKALFLWHINSPQGLMVDTMWGTETFDWNPRNSWTAPVLVWVTVVTGEGARSSDTSWVPPERVFYTRDSLFIQSNNAASLAADSAGGIWIGYDNGTVLRYNHRIWAFHRPPAGLVMGRVHTIVVAQDSSKWFGTISDSENMGGALWRLESDNRTWVPFISGIVSGNAAINVIIDIDQDTEGRIWVTTNSFGLFRYDPSHQATFVPIDIDAQLFDEEELFLKSIYPTFTHTPVLCLSADQSGGIRLGTQNFGMVQFSAGRWSSQTATSPKPSMGRHPAPLPSDRVEALTSIPDGTIFVCTAEGLMQWQPATNIWQQEILPRDDPGSLRFRAIRFAPHTGHIWLATNKGVYRKRGGTWTLFNQARSWLPSDNVYDVLPDPVEPGTVWVATPEGLVRMHPYDDGI